MPAPADQTPPAPDTPPELSPAALELDAHLRDDDADTGHGYREWDAELWRRVYGDRTGAEVHARDHAATPDLFGHTHDPRADR